MNKLIFILAVFSLIPKMLLLSQCETQLASKSGMKWAIFSGKGLDFTNATDSTLPTVFNTSMISTTGEGSATICDENGNLLVYTDGVTVWDETNTIITNGSGLYSNSGAGTSTCTQNSVIVPFPTDTNNYYIFQLWDIDYVSTTEDGFYYSVYNKSTNSITIKNIQLSKDSIICERVSTYKHADENKTWIVFQMYPTGNFYSYLITSSGISTTPVLSAVGRAMTNSNQGKGYMKFSPNGTKMAVCYCGTTSPAGWIEVYNFNNATGTLTRSNRYDNTNILMNSYGCEFSPNNRYLYVSSRYLRSGDPSIYQYDLQAANFVNSRIKIGTCYVSGTGSGSVGGPGGLQLGPDGRIYFAQRKWTHVGCIHYPDSAGTACGFDSIAINVGTSGEGLPTFVSGIFNKYYSISSISAEVIGFNVTFSLDSCIYNNADSIIWDLGNGDYYTDHGGPVDSVKDYTFSIPGTYLVTAHVYIDGNIVVIQTTVIIDPLNLDKIVSCAVAKIFYTDIDRLTGVDSIYCEFGDGTGITIHKTNIADPYPPDSIWHIFPGNSTYNVTAHAYVNGIEAISTTSVSIAVLPAFASSNSPLQSNDTLLLQVGSFTSYIWNGPNAFYSTDAEPVLPQVSTDAAGIYYVTVADNLGCVRTDSTQVIVDGTNKVDGSQTGQNDFTIYGSTDLVYIALVMSKLSDVSVKIYNINGQLVTSFHESFSAGKQELVWDKTDASGKAIPAGIYIISVETNTMSISKKFVN